jgi:hypothetical protein
MEHKVSYWGASLVPAVISLGLMIPLLRTLYVTLNNGSSRHTFEKFDDFSIYFFQARGWEDKRRHYESLIQEGQDLTAVVSFYFNKKERVYTIKAVEKEGKMISL